MREKFFFYFCILLIVFNIGIFYYANTTPIHWIQDEMRTKGFFWSMDDIDQFTLHTGLRGKDFLKPFYSYYVDGVFRLRPISYLFEMFSFKFWQYFETGYLRNYTLIFIHILNTFLLGILLFCLTRKKWIGWAGALLFLNSGVALATLLFPFRNAKLLVMTFFLLAWIIAASSKGKLCKTSHWRLVGFYTMLLMSFLTDEIAYFIFPLLFIYIFLRDEKEALLNKRLGMGLAAVMSIFIILAAVLYLAAIRLYDTVPISLYGKHWNDMKLYFSQPLILIDLLRSFFGYFLRRNFGYWDFHWLGILSGIAFLLMLILFIRKPSKRQAYLCLWLLIIVALKSFFLFHNAGVHGIIMPPDTIFPSLFYFSYYYVYCEALLFALLFGILLKFTLTGYRKLSILLILISVISLSNCFHLKNGPPDALAFHELDNEEYQHVIQNISFLSKYTQDKKLRPLYLSFPIDEPLLKTAILQGSVHFLYEKIIPIEYLRSIEEGRIITSVQNAQSKLGWPFPDELRNARFFMDVHRRQIYNLQSLKDQFGYDRLKPDGIEKNEGTKEYQLTLNDPQVDHIVFFIKGEAKFLVKTNQQLVQQGQTQYGQSYEMFKIDIDSSLLRLPLTIQFLVASRKETVYFVGPFAILSVR